ncbi:MAG: hypothetical protein AB1Z98_12930 [Nannocystaceae bacterium]
MKNAIPDEIITLYGTVAISRIATATTKAHLAKMPEVQKTLSKIKNEDIEEYMKKANPLDDFDVENGGIDEEFEDFMRKGFEMLIPDFGSLRPAIPLPIPPLPPHVILCARILSALARSRSERRIQAQSAERLQALVDGLSRNPHPLIVLLAALFKAALQEVQDRLAELDALIAGLRLSAVMNDC